MSRFISGSRKSAGCKDTTRCSFGNVAPAQGGPVSSVFHNSQRHWDSRSITKMSGNDDQSSAQPAASVVVPVTGAVMPLIAVPLQHIRRIAMPFANGDLLTVDPDIPFTVPAEMAGFVDESLPYFRSDDDRCFRW